MIENHHYRKQRMANVSSHKVNCLPPNIKETFRPCQSDTIIAPRNATQHNNTQSNTTPPPYFPYGKKATHVPVTTRATSFLINVHRGSIPLDTLLLVKFYFNQACSFLFTQHNTVEEIFFYFFIFASSRSLSACK